MFWWCCFGCCTCVALVFVALCRCWLFDLLQFVVLLLVFTIVFGGDLLFADLVDFACVIWLFRFGFCGAECCGLGCCSLCWVCESVGC